MNTSYTHVTEQSEFPWNEYEQIESAILAIAKCLNVITERHDAMTAQLERITRPPPAPPQAPAREFGPGFDYRGVWSAQSASIGIYLGVLRRLWTDFPERREAMAAAMSARGAARVYVARDAADLFPGRDIMWVRSHSKQLVEGWYVDTNHSRQRMRELLPLAVNTAGLQWGEDVKTFWPTVGVKSSSLGAHHGVIVSAEHTGEPHHGAQSW